MVPETVNMRLGHPIQAVLLLALGVGCGGSAPKAEEPSVSVASESANTMHDTDPGSVQLESCETLSAAAGLVELRCGEHRLVEFRKPQGAGLDSPDADLDELIKVLKARFGELADTRGEDSIDGLVVPISSFSGDAVNGRALTIPNRQGRFWGLACYRKEEPVDKQFCKDAMATSARAGGLAHVGAAPLQGLWGGLRVPEGCSLEAGHKIRCKTGELSWMPADGRDPSVVLDETLQRLGVMAKEESVATTRESKRCSVFGEPSHCEILHLGGGSESVMNFVFVVGGEPKSLVACIFSASELAIPEPCEQAISIE